MEPDSKVVPTHINAYKADLAEAEKEAAQAQSKVDQLRETIATMEAGTADTPINDQAAADAEAEEKRLANLKRDELEKEAEKAGVEDPSAAPNKEELAKETVAAQRDASVGEPEAPAGEAVAEPSEPQEHQEVAAQDASLPPSNGEQSVDGGEGVDEVPSQPIVETPAGSDMPPASSEAPSHHVEGDSADEGDEKADDEAADAEPTA